jgi:hypothetical protein
MFRPNGTNAAPNPVEIATPATIHAIFVIERSTLRISGMHPSSGWQVRVTKSLKNKELHGKVCSICV